MESSLRFETGRKIDSLIPWFPGNPLCLCACDLLIEIQLALEPGAVLPAVLVDLAQGGMCHIAEQHPHIHPADRFLGLRESF